MESTRVNIKMVCVCARANIYPPQHTRTCYWVDVVSVMEIGMSSGIYACSCASPLQDVVLALLSRQASDKSRFPDFVLVSVASCSRCCACGVVL